MGVIYKYNTYTKNLKKFVLGLYKYPARVYNVSSRRNRRDRMDINLTDSAKKELKQVIEEKGGDNPLRIYIAGYG